MKLTGLHLLLTYECNLECDHCFVWGSPWKSDTMTLESIPSLRRVRSQGGRRSPNCVWRRSKLPVGCHWPCRPVRFFGLRGILLSVRYERVQRKRAIDVRRRVVL